MDDDDDDDAGDDGWMMMMMMRDDDDDAGDVGPDDNVKCFCCDVGLKNWQPDDSPWVQHAHWRPRCDYLRQNRDTAFIADAQRGRSAVP